MSDAEEEDFLDIEFLNVVLGKMEDAYKKDIPVINSQDITQMEEEPSLKIGKNRGDTITI